ncbi:carbohydrate ABC transporter permease [Halanaerobium praevalens]|uniref:Carbohydrate ABC transporter membrane protein 2, CUT1 family n=1 Tax=Halanaerobium praevalens (strain ATCC 33744 / DSM 2228 / GSL) TaxID=572479 RepID=E3DS38_HALPG|nr:carbohydrate ABC transporter permease [Halanaerobium praevalens]ADO78186.1 carbohydrate ABC transporter membrane protein 2, CUT1 family [Halanaerobium praevalens DSM 2228]
MEKPKRKKGINSISQKTNIIFNILLFIISISCIVPFLFVFVISISSEASIANYGYQLIPKELSFTAYKYLWQEKDMILNSLGISVFITVIGTLIGLLLSTTMGYVLSRPDYKLKSFFTWIVFIPMIFNGGMVASYVVNANILHLRNTIWALILPLLVSSFNVIICKTFFKTIIPDSIVESAKIDGASQLRIFTAIVLPIAKPLLATISLFLSFAFWNDWFLASLYISKRSLMPLQALLNNIQRNIEFIANNPSAGLSLQQYASQMPAEGVRMAIAVVIVVPIALVYPFFQKYFVSGLTIGAVKG